MNKPAPCCSKCGERGFCDIGRSCCLECHTVAEEKRAAPYLSGQQMAWLRGQHRWLKANGWPRDAVARHSIEEMRLFREACPAEIVELIVVDHEEWEEGKLPIRDEP